MKQNIAIIIPAYNEAQNLIVLLHNIFTYLPHAYVIIVDDSAKEENAQLLNGSRHIKGNITILSRYHKLGRGNAIFAGMQEALKNKKTSFIVEMDADLSHDPAQFLQFIRKADHADVVLGSRYLPGSVIKNWPLYRLVQSIIINRVLHIWLGVNLTDFTNGFRLYNRKAVEYLIKHPIREQGFIALSEIAFRLKNAGFTFAEIPIIFSDRTHGKSNANIKEHIASLLGVIRLRMTSK